MPLVCNSRNTNASIGELGQALLETGTDGSTTGSNAQCASSAWPSAITAKPPQTTAMRLAKRRQIKLARTIVKDAKKPMPRPHPDKRKGYPPRVTTYRRMASADQIWYPVALRFFRTDCYEKEKVFIGCVRCMHFMWLGTGVCRETTERYFDPRGRRRLRGARMLRG